MTLEPETIQVEHPKAQGALHKLSLIYPLQPEQELAMTKIGIQYNKKYSTPATTPIPTTSPQTPLPQTTPVLPAKATAAACTPLNKFLGCIKAKTTLKIPLNPTKYELAKDIKELVV